MDAWSGPLRSTDALTAHRRRPCRSKAADAGMENVGCGCPSSGRGFGAASKQHRAHLAAAALTFVVPLAAGDRHAASAGDEECSCERRSRAKAVGPRVVDLGGRDSTASLAARGRRSRQAAAAEPDLHAVGYGGAG
eukprot:1026766-Prymnesium_polylepis.1